MTMVVAFVTSQDNALCEMVGLGTRLMVCYRKFMLLLYSNVHNAYPVYILADSVF